MLWTHSEYNIEEFDSLGSTNTLLMKSAIEGAPDKSVIISRSQTAGRGRYGRQFFSPENGLYMSILLRKALPMELAMLLTPMVACAVANAIEKVAGVSCGIKWVNDLYIDGKKVAGILTETKFDFDKKILNYAVIGIGINLTPPADGFAYEIKDIATALTESFSEEQRHRLICEILDQFDKYLYKLGSKSLMDEYRKRSVILGKEIEIRSLTGDRPAIALDIDGNGNLIVRSEFGVETLSSGEISVRLR